jgi:hypothetical protein
MNNCEIEKRKDIQEYSEQIYSIHKNVETVIAVLSLTETFQSIKKVEG